MILKGFKQHIKSINYHKGEHECDTDIILIGYEFKNCSAHVVSSIYGVELYEITNNRLQDEPTLVKPTEEELINKLKEMKGR